MSAAMHLRSSSSSMMPSDMVTYALDSLEVHFKGRRYALAHLIPADKRPTARLMADGRLMVSYKVGAKLKNVQMCEEIGSHRKRPSDCPLDKHSKKIRIAPSPPSPPRLDLPSPLLQRCWEYVRDAELSEGRQLAALNGTRLEAQLLVARVEVCFFSYFHETCSEPSPQATQPPDVPVLTRMLSIIEELPEPLPGVTEHEWMEFRRNVFSDQ